jgi:predicted ester cyclase
VGSEETANLETVRRLILEGFGGGNLAVVDEVCAPDFVEHQQGIEPPTREGLKRAIAFLHRLAPDLELTLEDSSADGDLVWARLRGRGTHGGAILGGPTGRAFEITVMDLCRLRQGKIVEHWGVADRLAQMQQLGLIPAGGPGASPSGAGAGR